MIRAVLFDLDDTLIPQERLFDQAFLAASESAARQRPGLDPVRLAADARTAARQLWEEGPHYPYCRRIGHSAAEGMVADYSVGAHPAILGLKLWAPGYRLEIWRRALALQGVADPGLPAVLSGRFSDLRRQPTPFPEVAELLDRLEPKYLLGIVTNGVPGFQRPKLEGSGIAGRFRAVAISGEVNIGKPDPEIFRQICGELGVAAAECVMVGDNPVRDIAGASAAGMRSVWVRRDDRPPDDRYPASFNCTNLLEMLPWLEEQA